MSSGGKYHFFLSENATGAQTAAKDIPQMFDADAGLVVVPHFKLPSTASASTTPKATSR